MPNSCQIALIKCVRMGSKRHVADLELQIKLTAPGIPRCPSTQVLARPSPA